MCVDILPRDVIRSGVLNKLDQFLQSEYRHQYVKDGITPFALQFTLYGKLDIDLLPSPYWSSADEYHGFVSQLDVGNRRKYVCIRV